ncbi:stage VI sporulation protein D [Aquibacillus sediminis]|uniref:stage VI sporulation protein D n=1 Tax=Aquibacillus sediminis TaxID=2574734 RepID=UPI0011091E3B|nr:stage VI sporulation protein D [Aquibacillus sediminis]
MTNRDQSVFTFDLNESLWFKRGQEVDEIMGISLEPEISIQEGEEFVSIRGVIELKGEYFQVHDTEATEEQEEQDVSLRDQPSQRFVDRVDSNEDGVNEFFHNFPVEVSIPKYRIESIDDVLVGIESFDYEIPENSQLKLNATVAIHGVSEGQERSDNDAAAEPEAEAIDLPEPPVDETFEFDVKEKDESVSELESPPEQTESPEREPEAETELQDTTPQLEDEDTVEVNSELEEVESSETKSEKERWKNKKSQSFAEFFSQFDKTEKESGDDYIEDKQESSSIESSLVSFSAHGKEESSEERESSREDETANDSSYLLNIFADEDEERVASMKMCIVQESDTLDSLAEKYKVTPMQLSNTNRLESDELYEGQILYIPSKVTKIQ